MRLMNENKEIKDIFGVPIVNTQYLFIESIND